MSNVTRLDDLRQKGRDHAAIKAALISVFGLDEDEQTFADMLEGESDLPEFCALALREAKTREALAEGLTGLIDSLKARRERLLHSVDRARALVADAMAEAGEKRIVAPDMTIALRQGKPRLILDEERLPDAYKIAKTTYKADRAAIQAAVDRGDVPDGVQIANGHPFVVVSQR
jgi:3'-phosphoadenosine 5'-phosphosulfate sulfotransferase